MRRKSYLFGLCLQDSFTGRRLLIKGMPYFYKYFALLCFVAVSTIRVLPAQDRPNIIFILVDDQRFDFLSFLDHPWIETPHIDRLAEKSLYFDRAYVTTSLCSPSRASILTGAICPYTWGSG